MCYYCNSNEEDCDEESHGDLVECQDSDEHEKHYGDACVIGHTGKII